MKFNVDAIQNERVRFYYRVYLMQRGILRDFFVTLPDEHYDFRMVDRETRKADSPRESLAHILHVQLNYLNAMQTGTLNFGKLEVGHYWEISRSDLIAEMDRMDEEIYAHLTGGSFDPGASITAPWGELNINDLLMFLRDHDVLHIGWNLAVIDHLDLPRYPSLVNYWGEGDEDAI